MKKVLAAWLCIAGFSGAVKAQLLWRVTHPVTQKTSFLFGTMHLAGFSYFEKHPAPLDSLKQCSRVITEAEMSDRGAMFTMFRYAAMPEGVRLSDSLTRRQWHRLDSLLQKGDPPVSASVYENYKPALAESVASIKMFGDVYKDLVKDDAVPMDQGIDDFAYKNGFTRDYLETAESQFELMFVKPSLSLQFRSLRRLLNGDEDSAMQVYVSRSLKLPEYYEKQATDSIAQIIDLAVTGDAEELAWNRQFLEERNSLWLKKLQTVLETERCFVAVGAAHLMREDGLVASFRRLGYRVSPVVYK